MSNFAYRPDIDGLRAVAVLGVVAYHYGMPLPGGYAGVDIFFVISGFLITSLIHREMRDGTFSLSGFYARRFRRIAPALLTVVVVTLLVGAAVLVPADYEALGESAAYASVGISNFYFLFHSDYFAQSSDLMPLLHTWSLGVEEQFYLIWPVTLLAAMRWPRLSMAALMTVIIASLAAAEIAVRSDQAATAFYMLHTRAWELAVGAFMALVPMVRSRLIGAVMNIAGLVLTIGSFLVLTESSPFPGISAVAPTIGAALIVAKKVGVDVASKALSLRPLVFVGLISYSLYLWHWPLLVLFKHYNAGLNPDASATIVLAVTGLAFSTLTWRFVEVPFRRIRAPNLRTIGVAAGSAVAVGVTGLLVMYSQGLPARYPEQANEWLEALQTPRSDLYDCFISSSRTFADFDHNTCINDGRPGVLLMGDSHAFHFADRIRRVFPEVNFSFVTASGCIPSIPLRGTSYCRDTLGYGTGALLKEHPFDAVIVSARWKGDIAPKAAALASHLVATVPHVYFLGPTIEYARDLPSLLAQSTVLGPDIIRRARLYEERAKMDEVMRAAIEPTGAVYLSTLHAVCPDAEHCLTTINDTPLESDYGHFTPDGAEWVLLEHRRAGLLTELVSIPSPPL